MQQGRERQAGGTRRPRASGDGYWLEHVKACAQSGEPATVYAERAGISVGTFYEAKRRLIAGGAWSPSEGARQPGSAFARVVTRAAFEPEVDFRLRLPSGATLEWATAPGALEIAALLGRL